MAIEFRCTRCNKLLRTADQSAGKKAKCPECGQILRVPSPQTDPFATGTPPPAVDAGPSGPDQAAAGPTGPAPVREELTPAKLVLGDLFRTTWEIFKREPLMCILAPIVLAVFGGAVVVAAWIAVLIAGLVTGSSVVGALLAFLVVVATIPFQVWLGIGQARFFLNVARGQPARFGDLFSAGIPEILPLLGASLLFGLMVQIGTLLFIVPGIIVATMFSQFAYLIIDRGMAVFDSLSLSRVLTNGNKMTLFVTGLVGWLGAVAFMIVTLGIGSLAVGPFFLLMNAVIYLRISSQPTGADG